MTTITKNFNTDSNFWETNQAFKTIKLFREFYEEDKSKKKENSSQIMWAIALLIDPNEANPWRNYSEESKRLLIADEYLNNPKFDFNSVKHLISEYENRCLTVAEKELVRFERKIVERGDFIANTKITLENAHELDKMMLNTTKITEQYKIIKDMLSKEESEGHLKAGAEKSASEKGLI